MFKTLNLKPQSLGGKVKCLSISISKEREISLVSRCSTVAGISYTWWKAYFDGKLYTAERCRLSVAQLELMVTASNTCSERAQANQH